MAGKQEWQLDAAAREQEEYEKYGWLWDDDYDEADSWGDSWVVDDELQDGVGSWDYPDPLSGKAL